MYNGEWLISVSVTDSGINHSPFTINH